ncbi:MAG: tetratricopeptide repeat protein [Elainella sp.]
MLELQAADPNQDAYDDLLAAIETSDDQLALLIAVCDDPAQRQAIIQRYETDLADSHQTYRLSMARSDPSLKLAIQELIAADSWQPNRRAVITVLDIERLSFWGQGEEKSPQEVFFGYLQWTREALREFRYPIVIWVTYQILSRLSRKSPDFWGWRKGVFRFVSRTKAAIPAGQIEAVRELGLAQISEDTLLPLADLEALIQQTEAQTPSSPLLASLYQQLARVYRNRLNRGEAANYPTEAAKAIRYFEKAIALQTDLDLPLDLATSLNNLAGLYRAQGRYAEAEPLLLRALDITEQQLGAGHPHVARGLNNLAELYRAQGRYAEAELLHLRALDITEQQLGSDHPDVALSLNNLARLYESQERYAEAEPLYLRALSILLKMLGENHPYTQTVQSNFRGLLRRAVEAGQAEQLSDHPLTQAGLAELRVEEQ